MYVQLFVEVELFPAMFARYVLCALRDNFRVESGDVAPEGARLVEGLVAQVALDAKVLAVVPLHVLEASHQVLEDFGTVLAPHVPAGVHVVRPVGALDVTHDGSVRGGDVGAVRAPGMQQGGFLKLF